MKKTQTSPYRLQYLDWLRGFGAVIMLQGHVFDSFLRNDLKNRGPYVLSQFAGGMPPAIFLFLTGVTLAFLMDSAERKGMTPRERVTTALRRSGYLFFLAFAFRLQLWIFGLPSPFINLIRVDILNCMGFAMAVFAGMAAFRTVERVRLCAVLGLAVAFASPLVTQLDSPGVPWLVHSYVMPDYRSFGFFPWGAYLAFGMSAGSAIRVIPPEATERAMQWAALIGGALLVTCQFFGNQPYTIYAKAEYWLNSPAQVLAKLGVTLLMLSFAFLWTRYGAKEGWSWVRQFGTTSLLTYWVHIELVYGRAAWLVKGNLTELQTAIAAVVVILLMLAISTIKTYRHRVRTVLAGYGWTFGPKQDRIAGD
jgi:peptidoglycan/LPS O-acetylase OafA/YrhL